MKPEWFVCQHNGCDKRFSPVLDESVTIKAPVRTEDVFGNLVVGLMNSRTFCMEHVIKHAKIICMNSKIPIEPIGHCVL